MSVTNSHCVQEKTHRLLFAFGTADSSTSESSLSELMLELDLKNLIVAVPVVALLILFMVDFLSIQ